MPKNIRNLSSEDSTTLQGVLDGYVDERLKVYQAPVSIQVTSPVGSNVAVSDGQAYYRVPKTHNNRKIAEVAASVATPGTGSSLTIQIRRVRGGANTDILSTPITIEAGEYDTVTATAESVVNPDHAYVRTGDLLFVDVDSVPTGAKGLSVEILFQRAPIIMTPITGTFALAEDAEEGDIAGAIVGVTPGATLSLIDNAGGRVAVSGNNIASGPTALDYESGTFHNFTVRQIHPAALNSPLDTILTLTVGDVSEGGGGGEEPPEGTTPLPATLLTRLTGATTYPPQIQFSRPVQYRDGDVLRLQRVQTTPTFPAVGHASDVTVELSAGAASYNLNLSAVTSGSWFFRARVEPGDLNPDKSTSPWSNILNVGDVTAPTITSSNSASVNENVATPSGTLTADEGVVWSIVGGADATWFSVNSSSGAWTLNTSPNYESPVDVGANNTYVVTFRATDYAGNYADQTFTLTVTDVDDTPPNITSLSSITVASGATLAHTLTANETVTWSIVGGTDAAQFERSGTTIRWVSNGTKSYTGVDGTYQVLIRATDTAGNYSEQTLTVTVTQVATHVFTGGVANPDLVSFSRTSAGWYANSTGVLVEAAASTPRFSFQRPGLTQTALLVEPAETNSFWPSDDMTNNTRWTKSNCTATGDQAVGPYGTATLDRITENAGGGNKQVANAFGTGPSNISGCFSFFARRNGRDPRAMVYSSSTSWVAVVYDLTNGVVSLRQQGSSGIYTFSDGIEDYGNGLYRCWVTFVKAGGASTLTLGVGLCNSTTPTLESGSGLCYTGNGVSGIYLGGMNFVASATKLCSPIPTTTAAASRAIDVPVVTKPNGATSAKITYFDDTTQNVTGLAAGTTYTPNAVTMTGTRVKQIEVF